MGAALSRRVPAGRADRSSAPSASAGTPAARLRLVDLGQLLLELGPLLAGHVASADDAGDDPLDAIAGARNEEPEVRAGSREISVRLRAALSTLPPAQREAFLLQQEGGLELSEIAAVTGAGIETVKSRLRYALAKLRSELGDLQ